MALVLLLLLQLNNPTRKLMHIDNSGHILVQASPSLVAHEIYRQVLSNLNQFSRPVCNGDVIWQVAITDPNQELGYRILAQVYMKHGVGALKTDDVAEREAHQVWTWLRSMVAHGLTVSEACK
jgi:hypothetical protein